MCVKYYALFLVNLLEIICSIPQAVKEELGDRHTCHEPLRPQDATVAFLFSGGQNKPWQTVCVNRTPKFNASLPLSVHAYVSGTAPDSPDVNSSVPPRYVF